MVGLSNQNQGRRGLRVVRIRTSSLGVQEAVAIDLDGRGGRLKPEALK